jgi:mRNA-degrading endonuclease toxin of MazEF toxin-antitoxin module
MVTVSINSIERYITLLTDQKILEINAAIRYALGLED